MSTTPRAPVQRPGVIALSLQESLWPKLETTASNLSKASVTGFKGHITQTREVKYTSPGHQSISYADTTSSIDFSQGDLKPTHNQFDLAISGAGFFPFQSKDNGVVYSRDGQLSVSAKGALVNTLGDPLLNEGGSEIVIPPTAKFISISEEGTIATDAGPIGKIGLKDFANKDTLQDLGQGYYKTDARSTPVANPRILQGFIESSNVNPINEVLNLVSIARLFENAQKLLDEDTKRQSKAINISPTTA